MNDTTRRRHIHAALKALGYMRYRSKVDAGYTSMNWRGEKRGMTIFVGAVSYLSVGRRAAQIDAIAEAIRPYGTTTALGSSVYIEFPTEGAA